MAAECRLCNRRAVTPSGFKRRHLGRWQPYYGTLCGLHLWKVVLKMERHRALSDDRRYGEPFDHDEFVLALTRMIEGYARLIDAGDPIEDCQAVSLAGEQCRYHGRQQVNGLWLCSHHARTGFTGTPASRAVSKMAARIAVELSAIQ